MPTISTFVQALYDYTEAILLIFKKYLNIDLPDVFIYYIKNSTQLNMNITVIV